MPHAPGQNVTDAKPTAAPTPAVAHALGCVNLFTRQWRNGIRDERLLVTVQQIGRHLDTIAGPVLTGELVDASADEGLVTLTLSGADPQAVGPLLYRHITVQPS